jgi:hypothetical protein
MTASILRILGCTYIERLDLSRVLDDADGLNIGVSQNMLSGKLVHVFLLCSHAVAS